MANPGRPMWKRAILHVDMDAFYASVEQLDDPGLRGRPVVVGHAPKERGVVAAASYEARPYGVRSAMPMSRALRLCPQAERVDPRMWRYEEISERVFAIFRRVTPLVQPISLDEAFLDVTGCQRLHGDPVAMARRIKLTIRRETGLNASVGIAATRFVAKIASDLRKPDGLVAVPEEKTLEVLDPLSVERIWGVGPATAKRLRRLGIETIRQLREWPAQSLREEFGRAGDDLIGLANGVDESPVVSEEESKSISQERTFARDVIRVEDLERTMLEQAEEVAARLRGHGLAGRTVFIKLRYADFTTITRRLSLPSPTCLASVVHAAARDLLRRRTEAGSRWVRLVGLGVAGLAEDGGGQGELFLSDGRNPRRQENLERAADAIRKKLGKNSIRRASLHFDSGGEKKSAGDSGGSK